MPTNLDSDGQFDAGRGPLDQQVAALNHVTVLDSVRIPSVGVRRAATLAAKRHDDLEVRSGSRPTTDISAKTSEISPTVWTEMATSKSRRLTSEDAGEPGNFRVLVFSRAPGQSKRGDLTGREVSRNHRRASRNEN